jgi:hypothetical protein
MLGKLLGFDCMHETKTFLFFVCFFKEKINLNFFEFVLNFQILFFKSFGEN